MHINNVELSVIVKGRPVDEFVSPMDFQTYIEGRDGSEFEVQISNKNGFDVEAIVSIDGLSIIDGKPAGTASAGYLVKAHETMTIPGWKVDGTTAARFQFSGAKGGSYVEKIGGDALNKGVIGFKAFAPKVMPLSSVFRSASPMGSYSKGMSPRGGAAVLGSRSRGGSNSYKDIQCSATSSVSSVTASNCVSPGATMDWMSQEQERGITQTLGTEFGAATQFKTHEVQFERGDLQAMMELYYDDRQGLKRRGIDVSRTTTRPSAFPADDKGCAPPAGWQR